jgi:hypothetical protein
MRFITATLVVPIFLGAGATSTAHAQETSTQTWANVVLALPQKHDPWYFEIDVEPKVQVRGAEKWANTDVTPLVEFYPFQWLDVSGELTGGFTAQNDDVRTWELTPKLGARLHLISHVRELQRVGEFASRLGLAAFFRIEDRNFWYSGSGASESFSSEWRFRARLETRTGLNRAQRSLAGTWYLFADAEVFVPLGDENPETFASKWRVRLGPGYTLSARWRFELLYIREGARNTLQEDFETDLHILNLRFRHYF